jgi:uncharacterized protein YjbJ (UPF0337 family)
MGSTDETKGRVEQAAGDLTDDKALKRQGQIDEASGKAKNKANDLVDKVAAGLKRRPDDEAEADSEQSSLQRESEVIEQ